MIAGPTSSRRTKAAPRGCKPKRRRRQASTARLQAIAVELLRLLERLRLRPNVRWIGRTMRVDFGLRIDNNELRPMLAPFVAAARDRRRMRRLSGAEAVKAVLEFCTIAGTDPSARWLGRFVRQKALGFAIADRELREVRRTYRARPARLEIVQREFRARAPHLSPAIGKGSPIDNYLPRRLETSSHARPQKPLADPGKLQTATAMQMLLALEPRLIPGRDGLMRSQGE
jgi:hypothetical protein